MAIEFFTGFEGCSSDNDVISLLNGYRVGYRANGGFNNSKCCEGKNPSFVTTPRARIIKNTVPKREITVGLHYEHYRYNSISDGDDPSRMVFRFTVGGSSIRVYNNTAGLRVYRDTTLIASTTDYIIAGLLSHVEFKCVVHLTEGYVGIKLDGVLVLEEENLNTLNDDITQIQIGMMYHHGNTPNRADNIFIADDWQGELKSHLILPTADDVDSPNRADNIFIADDWQGELKSHLILPTADDVVQFTPSAGTDNYALLQTNDGDTSYVSSDVIDEQDLYEFGPDLGMFEVHAVSIVAVARKDDVGARGLQTVVEYDGIAYDLESFNLPTSYPSGVGSAQMQCLDEAPNAAEWSPILINAMKAGFKVA